MKKLIASGCVLAILASPAFAAKQYWIVQQSINSCTVDEKPKTTVTIAGDNKGCGSRAEAERSIRTTKGCAQE